MATGRPALESWSNLDEVQARKLYDMGYCDQQIADHCDVDFWVIRKWRVLNGLAGHKRRAKIEEPKPKHVPTLSELAAEAKAHGMSYGHYIDAKRRGVI